MSLEPETLSRLLHDLTPHSPVAVTVDDVAARVRRRRRTRTAATVAVVCLLVAAAVTVPLTLDRRTGGNGGSAPAGQPSVPGVCEARALDMTVRWHSASGSGFGGPLVVTNHTGHACVLKDRPTIAPLDQRGVPLSSMQSEPRQAGPGPLVLQAGASALSMLSWANWCKGPIPSSQVRISWPGGGSRVVVASGDRPTPSCVPQVPAPAGDLSSNWFASLLSGPDRAITVSANETYFNGQVTLEPPARPVTDFPTTARDALITASGLGYVGGGTITVEYGLFSDNVQGTYDPATLKTTGTLKMTKLFYQRVPAYLVIMRTPYFFAPRSDRPGPGIVVTGIEAATGKQLGVYGQGGAPTSDTSVPSHVARGDTK